MIKYFLSQPYPYLINKWRVIIFVSCFIVVFIGIFQPIGLTEFHSAYKFLVIGGYGIVGFVISFVNLFVIPYLFKNWFDGKRWTVLKQILWLSWILFTIGIGNYLYTSYLFSMFWGFKGFFIFQFFTLVIGIIPIVILTIINQNIKLAYNLKQASEFNLKIESIKGNIEKEQTVCMIADNEKDMFEIQLSNLLYIEAVGNYVQIYYFIDREIKNVLLRSSLKRLELQLVDFSSLIKCHRAFIVNMNQIDKVTGNSQGLKLSLKKNDIEIPVSRNYSKELKGLKNQTNYPQ
jgi:hypothetical protein